MTDSLRHIDVHGHRIAIASHNADADGPPLVVIHGVSLSLNVWPHALHHTLRHRRWYAVGLPAHFPSQPPPGFNDQPMPPSLFGHGLLDAIRAVIGDEPFTVMGHSTGGYAALAIAAEAPEQVRAVCAISPFAQGRWRGIIGLLQFLARIPGIGPGLGAAGLWLLARHALIARLVTLFATTRPRAYWAWPPAADIARVMVADLRRSSVLALAHFFDEIYDHDIRSALGAITAPTLVIHGTADPIVPFDQSLLIQRFVPHAELLRLNGIGHMPFGEAGDDYAQPLEEWFDRVDA